jgi:hypothetical protein
MPMRPERSARRDGQPAGTRYSSSARTTGRDHPEKGRQTADQPNVLGTCACQYEGPAAPRLSIGQLAQEAAHDQPTDPIPIAVALAVMRSSSKRGVATLARDDRQDSPAREAGLPLRMRERA